jgi:glycosyltransferase involved in cell wall biosynthesis
VFSVTITALWTLRPKHKLAKLLAYLRHPLSAPRRKLLRGRLIEEIEFNGFEPEPRRGTSVAAAKTANAKSVDDLSAEASSASSPTTISVIIPNFNHARFLGERLRSILAQSIEISELIILDDASTDNSRDVILELTKNIQIPVKLAFNETNSGRIFRQWKKGLELAQGDLIWICESDDTCDAGFLRTLVPYFDNPSIMMAFGRIESVDGSGNLVPQSGLPLAASAFWGNPIVSSARSWFNGPFGNRNVVANVGGCIFRKQQFTQEILDEFTSYRICGDWFLYSRVARGGRIAYDPAARAYFRVHTSNSSKASLKSEDFYREHVRIARALRRHYGVGERSVRLLLQNAVAICAANRGRAAAREFARGISLSELMRTPRTVEHLLLDVRAANEPVMSFAGLLANALSDEGADVSLLADDFTLSARSELSLSPSVCVFTPGSLGEGCEQTLVNQFGITAVWLANAEASASGKAWSHLNVAAIRNSENLEISAPAHLGDAVQRQRQLIHKTSACTA